ncbi:hypothetical protein pdam_00021787, partial [Pocillopora damicornis]
VERVVVSYSRGFISNTDLVAKKLKEDSKISVRFEGNKRQFYFNSNHAEKMNYLEERDSDIKKCNKLIRLADRCAASWDLFNKYLSNELASGSEDEKCIRRAKQRAKLEYWHTGTLLMPISWSSTPLNSSSDSFH